EGQHLDGEGLVDLDEADVVHGQAVAGEQLLGGRDGADTHDLGVHSGEREVDQAHLDGQAEFRGDVFGGEDRPGGTVVEARGVARGHAAVRAERGLQGGQRLHGGAGARRFVDGGQTVRSEERRGGGEWRVR